MEKIKRIYEIIETNNVGSFSIVGEFDNYITLTQRISDCDKLLKLVYNEESDEITIFNENGEARNTLRYEGNKETISISSVGIMFNGKFLGSIFADVLQIRKYKLYSEFVFKKEEKSVCSYTSEYFDIEFADNFLRISSR